MDGLSGLVWAGLGGLGLWGLAKARKKAPVPSDGGVSVETGLTAFIGPSKTKWFLSQHNGTTTVHDERRRPIVEFSADGAQQVGGTAAQLELALKDMGLV